MLEQQPGGRVEDFPPEVQDQGRKDEDLSSLFRSPADHVHDPLVEEGCLVDDPGTDFRPAFQQVLQVEGIADAGDAVPAALVSAAVGQGVPGILRKTAGIEGGAHEENISPVGTLVRGTGGDPVRLPPGDRGVAPDPGGILGLAGTHGADDQDPPAAAGEVEVPECMMNPESREAEALQEIHGVFSVLDFPHDRLPLLPRVLPSSGYSLPVSLWYPPYCILKMGKIKKSELSDMTEFIGYIASFFIAVSLLMVSIVRLRIFNLVGCIAFTVYGLMIGSLPIVMTNGFIAAVNLYHLGRMFRNRTEEFTVLPISDGRVDRIREFAEARAEDIRRYYPLFHPWLLDEIEAGRGGAFLVFKDLAVAGAAFWTVIPAGDGRLHPDEERLLEEVRSRHLPELSAYLNLDYAAPEYRDLGLDRRLYASLEEDLRSKGKRFLFAVAQRRGRRHRSYLRRNGFSPVREEGDILLYLRTV